MLTRGFSLLRTLSQAAPAHSFCVSTQPSQTPTKTYRMPERKQIDLYKPEFPLRLHNYRVLLFANKQSLITPTLLQGHLGVSFVALIYLIRNNPWYLTFPASLPIMMGAELFIFFRWIFHKRHYKYIIERVYLEEGNVVEFVFSNKIRRKLKDTENSHIFNDPEELVTPDQGASGEEWTERGFPFPKELKYTLNEATREVECLPPAKPMFYGWTKYCANFQNYIFPKNYEYANWEILVPLLQGRYIDFEESTNQIHELPAGEDYAPMEQEMQWLKRDAQTNSESRKGRVQKGE